jgi:hypothetical protein
MKKLLETSLGNWDETWLSLDKDRKRVSDEDAIELIKKECNPYVTGDGNGVIVYMSVAEYDALQAQKDKE